MRSGSSSLTPFAPWRVLGGLCLLLALGAVPPAAAQTPGSALRRPALPRYDVVALRVEFQPDTTRFTTGTGVFDGALFDEGLSPKVDPLPHDAAYFQAHLDFLAEYVARVSDGNTTVTTHLLPEVVRVSQPMGAYSPTGFDADSDAERTKLVALVEEAWALASAQSSYDASGLEPASTVFILFHAGVGRDVELLGTTLDKTPLDLPSISFNETSLARLASGPIAFKGLPVRNTLMLPRTESRQAFDFIQDRPLLLELSINGLLAASFFNALGVPDLFNTETGESAIGPFALMDPLGIFAYNGLLPPEPGAWTKYYLGWVDPQELLGDGPVDGVLSASKAGLAPPTLARASISSSEYFLIENRNRDPEGDGLVLRVWQNGSVVEQRVENGQTDFTRFDVSGFIGGVVVGADNYDWALPGGLDEDGNDLNGGLLIWHIDERRLAEALAAGRGPNADPERRAIDLEEADSAQDLGFPTLNPFGPAVDQGTPFDFWFLDNPVVVVNQLGQEIRLYENRFGPATYPNSNSNQGGASFIVLEDFSAPGPEMSFTYRREAAAGILPAWQQEIASDARGMLLEGSALSSEGDGQTVLVFEHPGAGLLEATPDHTRFVSTAAVMPGVPPGGTATVLTRTETGAYAVLRSRRTVDGNVTFEETIPLPESVNALTPVSPVVVGNGGGVFLLFAGSGGGTLVRVDAAGDVELSLLDDLGEGASLALTDADEPIVVGTRGAAVEGSGLRWSFEAPGRSALGAAVFGRDAGGTFGAVPVPEDDTLLLLRADESVLALALSQYGSVFGDGTLSRYPVLVDLDADGRLDVLTTYGASVVAFSQNGALIAGFPIRLPAPSVAQPLVARLTESAGWSVVVAATDGYVYAFDQGDGGRPVPGFPLAVGARLEATPLLQSPNLYAVSTEGSLRAWTLDGLGEIWWGERYGDPGNRSFVDLTADAPDPQPSSAAAGLIVEAETYNWPNPVRDGQTFLRCMTRADARVRITIIDAAGTLVDEAEMELSGGAPAEHLWQTDAASGLYYARVTATGTDGRTATKLIKMAIVR